MKKIYTDTNIVSGLAKKDFPDTVLANFYAILNLKKTEKIELYVSEITNDEINEIPQEYRYYHNLIYQLLNNIALKPKTYNHLITKGLGGGAVSLITKGMIGSSDPLIKELENIIPQKTNEKAKKARQRDINHLYQYKKNNLDIFWTEDVSTILNYSSELEKIGIRVLNSQNLIAEINGL